MRFARLVVAAMVGNGGIAVAQCPTNLAYEGLGLEGPPTASAGLGGAVSAAGHTVLAGATNSQTGAPGTGAVVHFERSGASWTRIGAFSLASPTGTDRFGASVSLDGNRVLIGAPSHRHAGVQWSGAAFLFERNGTVWTEVHQLGSPGPEVGGNFAQAVHLDGNTAAVGAPNENSGGGRVTVFVDTGSTWIEQWNLAMPPSAAGLFGTAVALDGDTLAVGAPQESVLGTAAAGAVYVFARNGTTWSQQARVHMSALGFFDNFGAALALEGDQLIVGAPWDDTTKGGNTGSLHPFTRSGTSWTKGPKLTVADAGSPDQLGASLALDGDRLLAGAPGKGKPGGSHHGKAYLFQWNGTGWEEHAGIAKAGSAQHDHFGRALALTAEVAAVGAPMDDVQGNSIADAGSVSFWRLEGGSRTTIHCTPGTSSAGCTARISLTGSASATASSGALLTAAGVEGGRDGLFYFGTDGRQDLPWGNGTSRQCVTPPVSRARPLLGNGTAGSCNGTFTDDLNALWCPTCPKPLKNPGAGAVVQAQLWYRDPQSTSNRPSSLSDAVELCVGP